MVLLLFMPLNIQFDKVLIFIPFLKYMLKFIITAISLLIKYYWDLKFTRHHLNGEYPGYEQSLLETDTTQDKFNIYVEQTLGHYFVHN